MTTRRTCAGHEAMPASVHLLIIIPHDITVSLVLLQKGMFGAKAKILKYIYKE